MKKYHKEQAIGTRMNRHGILYLAFGLITGACGWIDVENLSLDQVDSASEIFSDTAVDTGEDDTTNTTADTDTDTDTDTDADADADADTDADADADTDTDADTETDTMRNECETAYPNALVCTGFEDGITLDTHNIFQGSLETVSTPVNSGVAALHARVDRDRSCANVSGIFPPMADGILYFRAYYFISARDLDGDIKLAALEGDDPNSAEDVLNVDFFVNRDGALWIHLHERNAVNHIESPPGIVPVDTWFCLSGSLAISDTAGAVSLSLNGQERLTIADVDTSLTNGVSMADFGIGWTVDTHRGTSVYVDDIVVDSAPVFCR